MFFKSEKKKSSAPLFIAVGALAALGAWCVYKKGKDVVSSLCTNGEVRCAHKVPTRSVGASKE